MASCSRYLPDVSQPFHHYEYDPLKKRYHKAVDGIVNDEVGENLDKVKVCFEKDLAKEVAKVDNLSIVLGYRLEDYNRGLRKEEAYQQLGQSASLFKAVLVYARKATGA